MMVNDTVFPIAEFENTNNINTWLKSILVEEYEDNYVVSLENLTRILEHLRPVYELLITNLDCIAYYDDKGYPAELKAKLYRYNDLAPGKDYSMTGLQLIHFYQCIKLLTTMLILNETKSNNKIKLEFVID